MSRMPPTKKKKASTNGAPEPRFEIDANGQLIALPLYSPTSAKALCMSQEKSISTSSAKKRYIPIEPLVLSSAELAIFSSGPSKVPKYEQRVRKELFKVPEQNLRGRCSTLTRRTSTRTLNTPNLKINGTPLLPIKEVDELQNSKSVGYAFKPLTRPDLKFGKSNPNIFATKITSKKATPDKQSLDSLNGSAELQKEFLDLEESCGAAPQVLMRPSPISDVCNLLKSTKLDNSPILLRSSDDILKEINNIVKRYKMRDAENDKKIEEILENNRQNKKDFVEIEKLVSKLATCNNGKENRSVLKRRSGRLLDKEIKNSANEMSPRIAKSVELRVSTVVKNFEKSVEEEASPRRKKATDMYNSFRHDFTMLTTPTIHKGTLDSPSSNTSRSLSRRLQQQCLLLQDTPVHK